MDAIMRAIAIRQGMSTEFETKGGGSGIDNGYITIGWTGKPVITKRGQWSYLSFVFIDGNGSQQRMAGRAEISEMHWIGEDDLM